MENKNLSNKTLENEIDWVKITGIIRNSQKFIFIFTLISILVSFLFTSTLLPRYESRVTLNFSNNLTSNIFPELQFFFGDIKFKTIGSQITILNTTQKSTELAKSEINKGIDFIQDKINILKLKKLEQLKLIEESILAQPDEKVGSNSVLFYNLTFEVQDLSNFEQSEIKVRAIHTNKSLVTILGGALGLLLSILIVFLKNSFKELS
jgi:uncharacterized protein involved in exopolysaccharide biosynthesis